MGLPMMKKERRGQVWLKKGWWRDGSVCLRSQQLMRSSRKIFKNQRICQSKIIGDKIRRELAVEKRQIRGITTTGFSLSSSAGCRQNIWKNCSKAQPLRSLWSVVSFIVFKQYNIFSLNQLVIFSKSARMSSNIFIFSSIIKVGVLLGSSGSSSSRAASSAS